MDHLQTDLENAAQGLLFLSETDAPFELVDLGKQDKAAFNPGLLLQVLHRKACRSHNPPLKKGKTS